MKKIVFFCNTHLQFMLACMIRMQRYPHDYATLFLGVTVGLKEMYDTNEVALKEIFSEVYWTEQQEMKECTSKNIYNWKKILTERFGNDFADYDEIFFYNISGAFSMVYKSLSTGRKRFKVHWMEEGYGSYIFGDKNISMLFPMKRIIDNIYLLYTKIFFRGYHPSCITKGDAWFVKPELIVGKMHRKIEPLFTEEPTRDMKDKCLKCYSYYNCAKPISEKYIFLGESFGDAFGEANEQYISLINKIADHVGYDDFLYKEHPRSPIKVKDDRIHLLKDSVPWEIIELSQNLEDKVCITSLSGACINSKYIFNSKTKVICIWPIFANNYHGIFDEDKIMEFLQEILDNYDNFIVVNTEDELMKLLDEQL